MKIKNETIAKVFSQYLGGTINHSGRNIYLMGVNMSDSTFRDENGFIYYIDNTTKIILKPFSAMSDKDAIEMAKKFGGIKGKVHLNRPTDLENKNIHFTVQVIVDEPLWKSYSTPKYWRDGYGVMAYQWLQLKGYDLPHYLLRGKTLYEAGLAIYETK